jgi:hypothetical protein
MARAVQRRGPSERRRRESGMVAALCCTLVVLLAHGRATLAEECLAPDGTPVSLGKTASLFHCLEPLFETMLRLSDISGVEGLLQWPSPAARPYRSADHGDRYVMPYANQAAGAFARLQSVARMPPGAILALPSFTVAGDGEPLPGPLYLMEKQAPGFAPSIGDWRYVMVLPDGTRYETTSTPQRDALAFCADCHLRKGRSSDSLIFPPPDQRAPQ